MAPRRAWLRRKLPSLLGAGLAVLALMACSPSQSQDEHAATPASPASSAGVATAPDGDEAVIGRISAVIRKHRLTALRDECLDYLVDDSDGATVAIDVHEKHDARCGGDPETSPRLFSFKLDRDSGQLTTDALDLADGDFQPIE
ncbi:hypothetical protein [Dyella sedimenti]|uniref:hypothetical protein n=1 Tax=Dyella sedimenti TaxID=2919947 RepID=UPI001FA97224|nr:hypothetical protein [Dyella sedimenti]